MEGLSASEIKALDEKAKKLGLDERILIENASSNLSAVIESLEVGKRVIVVSGGGNNGADVLSCARKLLSRGYDVKVIVLEEKPLGREAAFQKEVLKAVGASIYAVRLGNVQEFKDICEGCDFILEGILGVGIRGEVSPFLKQVITIINASRKKVVSCDIPSGLSPDEGKVLGGAVKADYTVSFIAAKKGFYINQGPNYCGKIFVVDIGVSKEILERANAIKS